MKRIFDIVIWSLLVLAYAFSFYSNDWWYNFWYDLSFVLFRTSKADFINSGILDTMFGFWFAIVPFLLVIWGIFLFRIVKVPDNLNPFKKH